MSSADLASWLLEQIAEDERMAQAVDPLGEVIIMGGNHVPDTFGHVRHSTHGEDGAPRTIYDIAAERHFARWHPARVLAECEAKRKIVMRCALLLEAFDDPEHGAWHDVNRRERSHARMTLEALALPFADRPGYQEEWRP